MKQLLVLATWIAACVRAIAAADSAPAPSNVGTAEYPRIAADLRVTFRLKAPNAKQVKLEGGTGLVKEPLDIARGDDGVWSVTTPPAVPGFHYYWFTVDALRVNDPSSYAWFGWGRETSGLEIPESGTDFYDARSDVKHGEVRERWYFSRLTGKWRRAYVYTPPDYDENPSARFPVLYLLHGAGENERGWVEQGRANFILDNLIAAKKAQPMILVVDSGYASYTQATGGTNRFAATAAFDDVMLGELMPMIDSTYRTLADRTNRAMAGLSMGSGQALNLTLHHLDKFAWIGAMSGPPRQVFEVATAYDGVFRDANAFNEKVKLLWFGAGTAEERIHTNAAVVHETLDKAGIKNVFYSSTGTDHEWQTWRRSLRDFAPRCFVEKPAGQAALDFRIQLDTISRGYDGQTCWVHPRAGAIPGQTPSVVLTMQKLKLTGSDVFFALNEMRSDDLGRTWRGPTEHAATLGRRNELNDVVVAACDFWPKWHAKSGKLLGIGHTVRYRNDKVIPNRPRETAWSVYDPGQRQWMPWTTLAMPGEAKFFNAGAGCVQRVDLPDGDILLPIYFQAKGEKTFRTSVLRCTFDGTTLSHREQGNELTVNNGRGLYEPSLTYFKVRYFLTLRNDSAGYVTASRDGLHFDEPRRWLWDDGTDLGNYNTQQHWVSHSDGLFLVYTRKGATNDHVFRHRAPLFIAQVDPEELRVIRNTERVLVAERGARLGNFGVTEVSEHETWVTVAEWMQTWPPQVVIPPDNARGADNSVYAARILWSKPNEDWDKH